MDKKFSNNKVVCESVKRFNQILEYVNASGQYKVNEDETDPMMPGGGDATADPTMGGEMGTDPAAMGGEMPANPAMGGEMGADPAMAGDPAAMGGEMPADPAMGAATGAEGFEPQGEDPAMVPDGGEEEEVIDVDDLTDSQEETEKKIDLLSDKFEKLLDKLDSFESQVSASNERMETLKQEIEKRNPTPIEKMSLRAKNSYPFNVTPDEYWDEKAATSNYSPEDDNNGADDPKYQITKDDIDNVTDWQSISKSLGPNPSLRDILDF